VGIVVVTVVFILVPIACPVVILVPVASIKYHERSPYIHTTIHNPAIAIEIAVSIPDAELQDHPGVGTAGSTAENSI